MTTYYIEEYTGHAYLRQTRFKGQSHPHDVCAVGHDVAEVLAMYDKFLTGGVEGHREDETK